MFDTYYTSQVTRDVTKHVHEHRAPTDASVRLLKEMEAAAQDKITESLVLKNNHITAILQTQRSDFDNTTRYTIIYDLNRHRRTVKYHVYQNSEEDRLRRAYVELSKDIAEHILRGIATSVTKG